MGRNVYDLVRDELGVDFDELETTTTVGATAISLLANNPRRAAFLITNLSASAIFIRPRSTASATAGVRLAPNGGSAFVSWKEDMMLPTRDWSIIGAAAGLAFLMIEYLIEESGE